jgi:hypothetical protein
VPRGPVDDHDLDTVRTDAEFVELAGGANGAPEAGEAGAKDKDALHLEPPSDWISQNQPSQSSIGPFKGPQFTAEVVLWALRWYLMFPISYRDLMLQDLDVEVAPIALFRWMQAGIVKSMGLATRFRNFSARATLLA